MRHIFYMWFLIVVLNFLYSKNEMADVTPYLNKLNGSIAKIISPVKSLIKGLALVPIPTIVERSSPISFAYSGKITKIFIITAIILVITVPVKRLIAAPFFVFNSIYKHSRKHIP